MNIELKTYGDKNQWRTVFSSAYPEHVLEQLSVCPFTDEMERIVKNSGKTRFNSLSLPFN